MAEQDFEWNAETIRALRKHMGLTQKKLAQQMNARQQTISEWETGDYKPRGTTIALLNIVAERAGFEYRTARDAGDEGKGTEGNEATRQRGNEATRQRGSEATRQRGSEATRQRVSESTRQRGSEAASQRGNEATRQRGNGVTRK